MTPIKQGEKLMLLAKRDQRSAEEIAEAMGVDKSYLPKLYKLEFLPRKPLQRAMEVFGVSMSYFVEPAPPSVVAEPSATYRSASEPIADLAQLREEMAALREEIARLHKMLEHEKATNTALAEAILNMSKR
jgi:transcriptional regulator with XRE-family HTH domain